MTQTLFSSISTSIIEGTNNEAVNLVQQALASGIEPLAIIEEALVPGMNEVGKRYECGEYFLPNLILSANGMQKAMQILEPALRARNENVRSLGVVVIGTVRGDIHEIGKSLVGTMLSVNGFQVHDLGVDVPTEKFIAKIQETHANFLGLSALLTTTMNVQREIIEGLKAAGLRPKVKVLVGGSPVTQSWANEIGADGYAEDAIRAVALARQLVN